MVGPPIQHNRTMMNLSQLQILQGTGNYPTHLYFQFTKHTRNGSYLIGNKFSKDRRIQRGKEKDTELFCLKTTPKKLTLITRIIQRPKKSSLGSVCFVFPLDLFSHGVVRYPELKGPKLSKKKNNYKQNIYYRFEKTT